MQSIKNQNEVNTGEIQLLDLEFTYIIETKTKETWKQNQSNT